MMWHINVSIMSDDSLTWGIYKGHIGEEKECVRLSFHIISSSRKYNKREVVNTFKQIIVRNNISWISPINEKWILNIDEMKELFQELPQLNWFKGKISIKPEFETEELDEPFSPYKSYDTEIAFYITPDETKRLYIELDYPVEIKESLEKFKLEYSNPDKIAFIMMEIEDTKTHNDIFKAIKETLDSHSIKGLRADEKDYHEDLYYNVLTYLYGCGFGIAVFEGIEKEKLNPNVSLEVGYMKALRKDICLLKDRTLKTLQTDLIGKLYKKFDPHDSKGTIPKELSNWLLDKGIVKIS